MKKYTLSRYPKRKPSQQALLKIYRAMRKHFGHRHWWPGETPFEVIVGAVLTQNAAWTNVEKAIVNLKARNKLSFSAIRKMPQSELASFIRPAGYFNVKAKRLKNVIDSIWKRYRGDLDLMFKKKTAELRKELLEINGVGQETADSILLYAGNKPSFVVDAYTRRIFERHRYLKGNETYEDIQRIFMTFLPQGPHLYNDYHAQIVETGKHYCRTLPRCESCPLRFFL